MNSSETRDTPHQPDLPGAVVSPFPENVSPLAALEGLLFVHNRPLSFDRLADLLGVDVDDIEPLIISLKGRLDADPLRGLQVIVNEDGVQLATKACISQVIQRLEGQKLVSLSLPALETLSVIAYKQPLTRAEIEAIRGVNCDGVISTLLEKKLIYVSGEKPVIGRPRLYSTTQDFLYYFGMKSLKELPNPSIDLPEQAMEQNPVLPETPDLGFITPENEPTEGNTE
jgi:segregation and condensation protein B